MLWILFQIAIEIDVVGFLPRGTLLGLERCESGSWIVNSTKGAGQQEMRRAQFTIRFGSCAARSAVAI